jgi:hypothetical protein
MTHRAQKNAAFITIDLLTKIEIRTNQIKRGIE